MPRPRQFPPEVRRRMILDAAMRALAKRGFQDLRLDEVARIARVAKGTLYLYFADKMDLLGGVFVDVLERMDERLLAVGAKGSALSRLARTAAAALAFIDEHQDFILIFKGGHPDLMRSAAGKPVQQLYQNHLRLVSSRLQDCVQEGALRVHDRDTGALLFDSLLKMFVERRELRGGAEPLASRSREFLTLLTRGLGSGQ